MTDELLALAMVQALQAEAVKNARDYGAALRAAVRGLWNGTYDQFEFFEAFEAAIRRGFTAAWYEGMKEAGLAPEDITPDEQLQLDRMIYDELGYVFNFADAISQNSKANGAALQPHLDRTEKWVARYTNVKNQALQSAKNDPVLEWVLHAEESCGSCLKMSGQRRRSSVWARLDIRPQHPTKLECMRSAGGMDVCKCTLVPTDQPPTRGRMPRP